MTRRRAQRPASAPPRSASRQRTKAIAGAVRVRAIDGLRGSALCLMIVYHFCFDLNWFGFIHADFNHDPLWLGFRGVIVSAFMLLVGISLVLARRAGVTPRRFWRRIAMIAFCAVLVSIASYVTFPETFITFGILHCIAVASVLAWPLATHPRAALIAGIAIVAAGDAVRLPLFDASWLQWVGLMTHKPATEDYVPILPWLGVVLIGIAIGHWLAMRDFRPLRPLSQITPRGLDWLGRHSLIVYLVHQPVLIGLLRVLRD